MKSSKMKQKLYDRFLKNKTYHNETTYKNYRKLFEALKLRQRKLLLENNFEIQK